MTTKRLTRRKSDWLIKAMAVIFWIVAIAAIITVRLWIAGPDCFFAHDIGVCRALVTIH